ncbi:MAG: GTPase HflX [Gammaproteobacteria bacterium]|nr:GTPase HflX [Gammaproteobacteria bacterium]
MNELSAGSERAVLVHINFRSKEFNEDLDEFIELAVSSGISVKTTITCTRDVPNPRYYIGQGKLDVIKQAVDMHEADVIIFNHVINPAQERNLERELNCRVIDRVELILDIFAQRARSYEGKLQVEKAQLQNLSTRLIRGWTHLERQKGGIGLRGPGETQLETDRRLIGKRIKTINARLEKVRCQRQQGRKQRRRSEIPLVSLVGYTNAGKSTLFNYLTGASVYVADKLFATLDPTIRRINVAPGVPVIVTDTVGFIRHIPHDLIEAFHATLEETQEADLLLHVIDVNDEHRHAHIEQVNQVINEIGASAIPQIEVYNKIDSQQELSPRMELNGDGQPHRVWLSARTGAGVEYLIDAIYQFISGKARRHRLCLPASAGRLRAQLFDIGAVYNECTDEQGGWIMEVNMEAPQLYQLCHESGLDDVKLQSYLPAL